MMWICKKSRERGERCVEDEVKTHTHTEFKAALAPLIPSLYRKKEKRFLFLI